MNLPSLLVLASLPVVGFVSWWLSVRRMRAIIQGQRNLCGLIVFVEDLLALLVFAYAATTLANGQWLPAVLFAAGGGCGARVGTPRRKIEGV